MQLLRILLLFVAVAAGAALLWEGIDAATRPQAARPGVAPARVGAPAIFPREDDLGPMARVAIEQRLQLAPEHSAFFAALRHEFPRDYEQLVAAFAKRAIDSSRLDAPEIYLAEAVRTLRRTHGLLAARAQAGQLEQVFAAQARIMDALAGADAGMCVDFLYGHATDRFYAFFADNRALLAGLASASLQAILDGRESKIQRPAPSDADFRMLEGELLDRGLGRAEIEALLDGRAPNPPLPDPALCKAGRVYLEALKALPEETRLRIYALAVETLARS